MAVDLLSSLNKNGSGMNLTDLATTLTDAEILPRKSTAEAKIEATEATISAMGLMKSNIQNLDTALDIARSFSSLGVTVSSDELGASLQNGAIATEQSATIEVQKLASRQVLEFSGFTSASDTFDAGTIQLEFGSWDSATNSTFTLNPDFVGATFEVEQGATLTDIAASITAVGGVAARIIDKGDGTVSLGITTATGEESAVRLTVTPGPASGTDASLSVFDTTTTNADVQLTAASNSEFSVDGISVSRATNNVSDVLDGIDLDLTQVTTGPVNINVARDENTTSVVVDELVYQLNQALSFINEQTRPGINGAEEGPLSGNLAADSFKRQLQSAISSGIPGFGDRNAYLADFGIQTERDGTLTLNETKMKQQYARDPQSFDALFNDGLSADRDGFAFADAPKLNTAQNFDFKRDATTGDATLNGAALTLEDSANGQSIYRVTSGELLGAKITVDDGVNSATLRYGVSFATGLQETIDDFLGAGGVMRRQEDAMDMTLRDQQDLITELDERAVMLEDRYRTQFGQMESIISQLNSTGQYLDNLIAAWNKD